MKKVSYDDTRMSISSDDDINESVQKIDTGSTKKCIIGIIILVCLVFAILIALDMLSIKSIFKPFFSSSSEENKSNVISNADVNKKNLVTPAQNGEKQENKPLSSNKENKPSSSNQENKPSSSNKENKPSSSNKENKPSSSNKENKPSSSNQENKPSSSNKENKPSSSNQENKPSSSNKENKPSSSNKENKPSSSNKENKPSSSNKENKPSSSNKENKSSSPNQENKSSSSNQENKSSSSNQENKSSSSNKENKPSSSSQENKPSSSNTKNKPSSSSQESKPEQSNKDSNKDAIKENKEGTDNKEEKKEDNKEEKKEDNKEEKKEEEDKSKKDKEDKIEKDNKLKDKDLDKESKTKSKKSKNKDASPTNGNIGLNPNYYKIDPNDSNFTYIPVVGIDDVHGLFFPKVNKIKIGENKTLEYKTGGLEYIARYLNILREDFGPERVLYFDSGDFYQGGIDSVLFDGEIMQDFYNLIGINGTTIGNHEFDYSREWVEKKIKKGDYSMLINNIKDNSTDKKGGALGKKQKTSKLYKIKLKNGDTIKIGVIGLSYNMKNDKTMPNTWGNRNTWDNISFYPYMEELEKESEKLRKNGAVAVLALAHFGLVCNQTLAMKLDMYNKSSIQGECFRDDDDSVMFKLTDKLKPGIIDGIIGGDTHYEMHHWENGIPLMSTPTHARYINIMYLPFKKNEDGNYTLVNDEIKIEGPLPACEKIFKNYQNCELISSDEYKESGKLIKYYWREKKIKKDKSVKPIYDKYYEKYEKYACQNIVTFEGFGKIKVDKSGDCTLCNTYLDAIVDIKKADFAIINRGIFPEELVPGTLTRAEFYNQMPYLDKICTVNVTGKELKDIVETVQTLGKGFYPSSNLKQTIKINKAGNKTLADIELYINGTATKINDTQIYKMASSLFVLSETSGEDFAKGKAFTIIHNKAVNKEVSCSTITIDDEMSKFFKGKGVIDLSNKVDPKNPRISIIQE